MQFCPTTLKTTQIETKVMFRGTHWIRLWALLQHAKDEIEDLVKAYKPLESYALDLYASRGWPFMFRIAL